MMQPPRQMVAIMPRSMFQPYSALPAAIWSKPWAYATTLDAYSARRTSSVNVSGSAMSSGAVAVPNVSRAAARWSACPDSDRANVASAMPVIGMPRSSALCTVHRPVPFCSAWSSTMSTNGLPVSASVCASTSAVIWIRNESRSPSFQVRKISAIRGAGAPRPARSRS